MRGEKITISFRNIHNLKTISERRAFGLTSQMRRAAVSITSTSPRALVERIQGKIQFYYLAQGSLTELKSINSRSRY